MNNAISSKVYNYSYYKMHSKGKVRMLKRMLPYMGAVDGLKILDLGCGSGDLTIFLAKKGAEVVGIDYSEDGIKLARQKLKKQKSNVRQNATFYQQNAESTHFKNSSFDLIVSIDLFEHLYKEQLEVVMKKITKALKSNGGLVVHTEPNKIYLNFTHPFYIYPVSQLLIKLNKLIWNRSYPGLQKDPRNKYHKEQHVNEPTYFYLKDLFRRHGCSGRIMSIGLEKPVISWKDRFYNLIVLLSPISKRMPLSWLFAYDYICVMEKNK